MSAVITNIGEDNIIKRIIDAKDTNILVLRLFSNNYTPTEGSIKKNFKEVNVDGYNKVNMHSAAWVKNADSFEYNQVFEFNKKTDPIYGYYVTDGSKVVFAERFLDGPYNIKKKGDKIELTIRIGLRQ
jgi:hypothetical protein